MKNAMRTLVVSLLALTLAMPAAADTLPEAQAAAVQSNPALAAQRQRLNATRDAQRKRFR
jgi:outer membrane protein